MSRYKREIDTQCCNAWMQGIRTINGQYPNDNRDLTLTAGAGISITPETAGLRITNTAGGTVIAGDNIEITPSGDDHIIGLVSDPVINGDLQVNGDIIQNGSAYETHAEKVYTTNDYIITRDGAISALSAGDYSGFQVKKYDGTNDGRLVIDNAGVARVGDVGDEQPLLTRDESADLTNGDLLKWDGTNQKAVDAGVNTSQIVRGTGNIGSDTKPVKVVNGVATPVSNALQTELTVGSIVNGTLNTTNCSGGGVDCRKYGKLVIARFNFQTKASISGTWTTYEMAYDIPYVPLDNINASFGTDAASQGWITFNTAGKVILNVRGASMASQNINGSVVYFTS